MDQKLFISQSSGIGFIENRRLTVDRKIYYTAKRIFDLTVAISGLILLFPFMLLIGLLIILDSPGPIFFVQDRVGARRITENGLIRWQPRIFKCYKYRTMLHNADPGIHMAYVKAFIRNDQQEMSRIQGEPCEEKKLQKDPRITRMGKFLRKCSLDELPQILNIIKGNMSLVGPRPPIPYEVQEYQLWHKRRLQAQPGLTGLWQISARSSADFDEMVQLDLDYIENQSIWLDLKIILITPWVILTCKGGG